MSSTPQESGEASSKPNLLLWGGLAGLAAAGLVGYIYVRNKRRESIECVLAETRRSFTITPEQLRKVQASFQAEMVEGLRANENSSALKMIPTFVTQMPTGQETVSCPRRRMFHE
jgi:hypothetical protein